MIKKTTYTRALEACEAFFVETGQVPTIDAIKLLIGINSPSTISSAIKDWKAALSQIVKCDKGAVPGIPSTLLNTIDELWQQALEEARQVFNERVEALQTQQSELDSKETALLAEATRIQHLLQLSEQRYQDDIAELKINQERLSTEVVRLTEHSDRYRSIATAMETDNAVLKETIRQEQDKLQRLEAQYDKEHDWALMRIEQEKESHRQQTHQEIQRSQSENIRSKQDLTVLQAKFEQLLNQHEENRNQVIKLEHRLAKEMLNQADLTLKSAHLQNELNDKNDLIRSLQNKSIKKQKQQ